MIDRAVLVFVFVLFHITALPLADAADTAIALYSSRDCASVELPMLVVPGSDILTGNCVSNLGSGANSIQAISLGGDCSVTAYFDESCSAGNAAVGLRECVAFSGEQFYGLGIQSFRINGGKCDIPAKAVTSQSADVPAATSTRLADPLNTDTSAPASPAEATTPITLDFGTSVETSTTKDTTAVSTSSPGQVKDTPQKSSGANLSTSSPGQVKDTPQKSSGANLSTILPATIIPLVVICVLVGWYCMWKKDKNKRARRAEEQRLHYQELQKLSSNKSSSGNRRADYSENITRDYGRSQLGDIIYQGNVTYHGATI